VLTVKEALRAILSNVTPLPFEEISLTDSLDRVLTEDIYADCDIPQLANSAMDGYAVKSSDVRGASKTKPGTLKVIYDLRAGYVAKDTVKNNQAMRIMTGAPIPEGADSVIIVEETEKEGKDKVKIFKEVKPGDNIRKAGEDIKKEERVLTKGTLLNSAHIGILASLGHSAVKVTRKPKVAYWLLAMR